MRVNIKREYEKMIASIGSLLVVEKHGERLHYLVVNIWGDSTIQLMNTDTLIIMANYEDIADLNIELGKRKIELRNGSDLNIYEVIPSRELEIVRQELEVSNG